MYFDPATGAAYIGWHKINGLWYYFYDYGEALNRNLQLVARGTMSYDYGVPGDEPYALGDKGDGSEKLGWQQIVLYYIDDLNNPLNPSRKIAVKAWYYYDANGNRITGWLKDGGKWYYLDPDNYNGAMVANTTIPDEYGNWYRFDKDGAMITGWFKDSIGAWYYYDANGIMHCGWLSWNGAWYFFNDDGLMIQGQYYQVGGVTYYFRTDGQLAA